MKPEKLTIEHLAPYLPYRLPPLKIMHNCAIKELEGLSGGWNVALRSGMLVWDNIHVETIKPILRPMSDYDNSEADKETYDLCGYYIKEKLNEPQRFSYKILAVYLKHHFDVFGLIEAGLAVDINSLYANKDS